MHSAQYNTLSFNTNWKVPAHVSRDVTILRYCVTAYHSHKNDTSNDVIQYVDYGESE